MIVMSLFCVPSAPGVLKNTFCMTQLKPLDLGLSSGAISKPHRHIERNEKSLFDFDFEKA